MASRKADGALAVRPDEVLVARVVQRLPDGEEIAIGEIEISPSGESDEGLVGYAIEARRGGALWRRGRIEWFAVADGALVLLFRALEAIGSDPQARHRL